MQVRKQARKQASKKRCKPSMQDEKMQAPTPAPLHSPAPHTEHRTDSTAQHQTAQDGPSREAHAVPIEIYYPSTQCSTEPHRKRKSTRSVRARTPERMRTRASTRTRTHTREHTHTRARVTGEGRSCIVGEHPHINKIKNILGMYRSRITPAVSLLNSSVGIKRSALGADA